MKVKLATACAVAAWLVTAGAVQALTLTNRDTSDVWLEITEQESEELAIFVVEPGHVIEDVCTRGCTIRTEDGDEEDFEGTEIVEIKDGELTVVD